MKERPHYSDGCTAFPEGPWSPCCWAHDRMYRYPRCVRTAWDRLLADVHLARCAAAKGYPQIAFLLFVGVRVGGWWPWLTYRVRARARKKAWEEQRKLEEERRIKTMLALKEALRRRKAQGLMALALVFTLGCANVSVRPSRVEVFTLGEAEVAVVQTEAGAQTVHVKGAALSSVGAGVFSSIITGAVMYFTGGVN